MKPSEKNYKRIVVKIGSSLFYSANKLDFSILSNITCAITGLIQTAKEVVVVSSGAIALGMHTLSFKERPRKLEELQAAAAVGQNELMNTYRRFFGKDWFVAQILLTQEDFFDRSRYLNAKKTLIALLQKRKYRIQSIVPVINENDTIATDEIKFGDNDKLSALVATLINADLLVILSDVDGLLDKENKIVHVVPQINSEIKALAHPTNRNACVGGMLTKIEAAKIAVDSGIPCVIANGRRKNLLSSIAADPLASGIWTVFVPRMGYLAARQRWIAFGAKPKGSIRVDDGAKNALQNKKSLLSVGVVGIEGDFEAGDIASVIDTQGSEFARGKVGVSSRQLGMVLGSRSDKEVIHRDNIVLL